MSAASSGLELTLAGPLRLTAADGADVTPRAPRAQALLALLGAARDLRRPRSWLQDKLWSAHDAERGGCCLRQTLIRLRRSLGPADCLIADRGWIGLDPARVRVVLEPAKGDCDRLGDPPAFADGLDIEDLEFEDWLREQRQAFASRVEHLRHSIARERETRLAPAGRIGPPGIGAMALPRVAVLHIATASPVEAQLNASFSDVLTASLGGFPQVAVAVAPAGSSLRAGADLAATARTLDVSYLVLSRLAVDGEETRLLVQLIDARSAVVAWSERYSVAPDRRRLANLAEAVAWLIAGLEGEIVRIERGRARLHDASRADAYELYLRAGDGLEFDDRNAALAALAHAERVTELEPRFARGWLMLNWRRNQVFAYGWGDNGPGRLAREQAVFRRSVELGPRDPIALAYLALSRAKFGATAEAIRLVERASERAGRNADAAMEIALAMTTVAGQPERALATMDRALRHPPVLTGEWGVMEARAAFFAGQHERALASSDAAPDCLPKLLFRTLAASELGDRAAALEDWTRLRVMAPHFGWEWYAGNLPITHPKALSRYRAAAARFVKLLRNEPVTAQT